MEKRIYITFFIAATLFLCACGNTKKDLSVTDNQYVAYLFTYFTGNQVEEEAIHFAISPDGYNYLALNKNRPVIHSIEISSTGGVRDPHILRTADGNRFYMVVTDMTSQKGWDSNRAFVMLKSDDLINWDSSVINIQQKYSGQEELNRVWAPQTIFDEQAGKYMVYWSMKYGDRPDVIYYAYANDDFTDLEGEPKPLFTPSNGKFCIDADIIQNGNLYYMFYKTEDGKESGIKLATTPLLTSGQWTEYAGFKEQTTELVEGSSIFKHIQSDTYVMMYDVYAKGEYQFTESEDLENFRIIDQQVTMNFKPRHGSIIPITQKELDRLTDKWGMPPGYAKQGNNPVISGFHADPEILYSHKTGKFYLYPTSDGFEGWGGYYFHVFSSTNLVDWKDEGKILDLSTDQVPWATGNAWAPAAEEKMIDGQYKYFFYYSGQPVAGGGKQIGVAIADDPTGPFTDLGKPLIDALPEGIKGGQNIDVDVFIDPVSGKPYIYWGNGFAAVAELNADMVSYKPETVKDITPRGGTLADYNFREALYVFYRNGLYYFMWSVDDTGSPNYHVAYGTSDSPEGPITVAEEPVILIQEPSKEIYGPAHNSIIQIPGTDEWYIVYHRINKNYLKNGPGFHREVCIDKLEFNADGTIKRVIPTQEGINPVKNGK